MFTLVPLLDMFTVYRLTKTDKLNK